MGSNDLTEFELVILKGISLGFDHKKMANFLGVNEKEVVEAIKTLIRKGYVTYKSKLIGGELKLTRKGYEVLAQYGGGISLKSKAYDKITNKTTSAQSTVQKSGSKLKKAIIAILVIFIVFVVILPRLPELFTAIGIRGSPIKPLKIEVTAFSVRSIDLGGLKGTVYFKVYNPNVIPAKIDSITYSIYDENGNLLAQGEIARSYTIPPDSTITIQNDVDVGWTGAFHIIKNVVEQWITGKKQKWIIEGTIHMNAGIATFNVPFLTKFEV